MNSFVYAKYRREGEPLFTPNLNTRTTHHVYKK
jgi:hypothetical protein